MKILALDTSTEACSAALLIDDAIDSRFEIAPQKHSQLILPMCDDLLQHAKLSLQQLDAIAFARGPGSFTGLRIAAGVTQGLAFGADLPVIAVSTLQSLAHIALTQHPSASVICAIDARMSEVYWAEYSLNNCHSIIENSGEQVSAPNLVSSTNPQPIVAIGSGWKVYEKELEALINARHIDHVYADARPSAEQVAQLAATKWLNSELLSAEQAIPVYLRNDVAKKQAIL